MKKKLICLGILTVIMLAGCGDVTTNNSQKESSGGETIKVGVLRTTDSLPLYIGDAAGLFEECGAEVELIDFSSASDQSKAIESGAIDAMMTDMVVQSLLKKGGTDLKAITIAIGATAQEGKCQIVSSPNSGVSSVDDIADKSIAISEGTFMEYLVDSYFEELGLDVASVKEVVIPSLSLRYETLMADEVDLAILPNPVWESAVSNGGTTVIDGSTLDTAYYCTVIAFTEEFISNHPEQVKRFIKGYNKSVNRLNEKDSDDLALIYEKANVPEELQSDWMVPTFSKNCLPTEDLVEDIEGWMVNKELIQEAYSYEDIVDDTFISEAN